MITGSNIPLIKYNNFESIDAIDFVDSEFDEHNCYFIINKRYFKISTDSLSQLLKTQLELRFQLFVCNNTHKTNETDGPNIGKFVYINIDTILSHIPCIVSLFELIEILRYSNENKYTFILLKENILENKYIKQSHKYETNIDNKCEPKTQKLYDAYNVSDQMIVQIYKEQQKKLKDNQLYVISPQSTRSSPTTSKTRSNKGSKESPKKNIPNITIQNLKVNTEIIKTNVKIKTTSWNELKTELIKLVPEQKELDLENPTYFISGQKYTGTPSIDFPTKNTTIFIVQFKTKS